MVLPSQDAFEELAHSRQSGSGRPRDPGRPWTRRSRCSSRLDDGRDELPVRIGRRGRSAGPATASSAPVRDADLSRPRLPRSRVDQSKAGDTERAYCQTVTRSTCSARRLAALQPGDSRRASSYRPSSVAPSAWSSYDWVRFVERLPDENVDEIEMLGPVVRAARDRWWCSTTRVAHTVAGGSSRHAHRVRGGRSPPRSIGRRSPTRSIAVVGRLREPLGSPRSPARADPCAHGAAASSMEPEEAFHEHREAGQGVHRGRRHLPGRALAAVPRAAAGRPVHDLPAAAARSTRARTSSSCVARARC